MKFLYPLLALPLIACTLGCGTIRDATLVSRFNERRPEFDRLVEMVDADTHLYRIKGKHMEYRPVASDPLPRVRIDEYRTLMKRLKLRSLSATSRDDGSLVFTTRHFFFGGQGYLYSLSEPGPLVKRLDTSAPPAPGSFWAARHLEDNWYLYLSRGM